MLPVERNRPVFEGAVSSMRVMFVHQKPAPKAAPPSEPSMTRGRSTSRKRSVRGRSQTGRTLREPCRYFWKGTCTRSRCEYWHPPECQLYKNESGCKAGDSQRRPTSSKRNVRRKRVGIAKTVPQLGCVSQDSESLDSLRGRQSRGNPMQKSCGTNSTSTIHTVYATSSKYPRK